MASANKSSDDGGTAKLSAHALDQLTGGAFSASTSGERATRVREWLASQPDIALVQDVFKEMSSKDKGAAKPLRERLDEIKRQKAQESIGQEWAQKAEQLLAQDKLNIADAMAWQRDAAKAGAGLSREPLMSLKQQLVARVSQIEDLQNGCQIQREAAVLLTQRTDVLSTKSLTEALAAQGSLKGDFEHWQTQALELTQNRLWASIDAKFPPLLEGSGRQLQAVWNAFSGALEQALAARADASAELPNVPMWAEEIRKLHGLAQAAQAPDKTPKAKVDPEKKAEATAAVTNLLADLEGQLAEGHGKATVQAASLLRQRLKEFGGGLDHALEVQAHNALNAAGELEGWQRWRADQLRQELVTKAQGLLNRPAGQALGGKKIQEQLRGLREQWKATDQGGNPNHALWKKFDEACNEAHKVVDAWIEKVKSENVANRQARLDLIQELAAWTAEKASGPDWKDVSRSLHQFAQRWQDAGHVNEKTFTELAPLWKAAFDAATAPIDAVQAASVEARKLMTAEADALGAQPVLNINAVKELQKRWQTEASRVPLERRFEQKLWDRFRKPIDDAFGRKTQEREKAVMAMGAFDQAVVDAANAVQQATQSGDAAAIHQSMQALRQVLSTGGNPAQKAAEPVAASAQATPSDGVGAVSDSQPSEPAVAEPPKPAAKPVVAMRGDDRPGAKRAEAPAPAHARGERPGAPRRSMDGKAQGRAFERREPAGPPPPRLGDTAFRAQRNAFEGAEMALKKLTVQAHGEVLTQVLSAWQARDAALLPGAQALGAKVSASARQAWTKALTESAVDDTGVGTALLRLEMATDTPTPAAHIDARRALQLQLLTRRNDPTPKETWGADVAKVLQSGVAGDNKARLQAALKVLLQGR